MAGIRTSSRLALEKLSRGGDVTLHHCGRLYKQARSTAELICHSELGGSRPKWKVLRAEETELACRGHLSWLQRRYILAPEEFLRHIRNSRTAANLQNGTSQGSS